MLKLKLFAVMTIVLMVAAIAPAALAETPHAAATDCPASAAIDAGPVSAEPLATTIASAGQAMLAGLNLVAMRAPAMTAVVVVLGMIILGGAMGAVLGWRAFNSQWDVPAEMGAKN